MKNVTRFVNSLKAERLSPVTIENYKYEVTSMLKFVNKPSDEVTYQDLLDWQGSMADMAANTVNKRIMAVRKFYKYLTNVGVIGTDPTDNIKSVKAPQEEAFYVPFEDAKKMIKYGKNPRDKAIIALFLSTGLRYSEVANLTLDDYDNERIVIRTKGNKLRSVWLNDMCRYYIDEYLKVRKESKYNNLFISNQGTPMKNNSLNNTLKVIAKRTGISCDIHLHSLRHSVTSELCHNYGIEMASKVIGHNSIKTTARYCHDTQENIKTAMLTVAL